LPLSWQLDRKRKRPTPLDERVKAFALGELREARLMRKLRLQTETSTQIGISAWPKALHLSFQSGVKNNFRNSPIWQVF
jgi:hypothetical protein